MRVEMTDYFSKHFTAMPQQIQKAFGKQLGLLLSNPKHPSLRAKIVDPEKRLWQARVTQGYRFYYSMEHDLLTLHEIKAHD